MAGKRKLKKFRKLKGWYYARIKIPRPGQEPKDKLIALGTKNSREAQIRLMEVLSKEQFIKAGLGFSFPWQNRKGIVEVIHYTLKEAVADYLKARRGDGLRQGTLNIYENALKHFISITRGGFPVEQIKLTHINQFKTRFIDSFAVPTMNMNLRAIKTFLIWLKDNERIESIPKIKMLNVGKPLPIYVTNTEFEDILKQVDLHFQRAFHFYRETGCRLSEPFIGVLNGNFLTIEAETAKGHQTRDIYLRPELKQILIEMKTRLNQKVNSGISTERNAINRYSRIFQIACIACKIEGRKFHSLRHTFAVRCYLNTKDIYEVAKRLGHSSVITTEIYAKFDLKRLSQDFPDLVDKPEASKTPKMHDWDTDFGESVCVARA